MELASDHGQVRQQLEEAENNESSFGIEDDDERETDHFKCHPENIENEVNAQDDTADIPDV